MDCKQANRYIHEYLDEEISRQQELQLEEHLIHCVDCKQRFQALQQTVAFVQSASHIYAPVNFTDRVLAALPKESYGHIWRQRMRRHPLLVAASLFLLLMTGSLASLWNEGNQFQLTSNQLNKLQIDELTGKVIVPEDIVVNGDIVVRNADIDVKGQVNGSVTAIDGSIYLASTGAITGEKEEIHQAVEWVWYHMKRIAYHVVP